MSLASFKAVVRSAAVAGACVAMLAGRSVNGGQGSRARDHGRASTEGRAQIGNVNPRARYITAGQNQYLRTLLLPRELAGYAFGKLPFRHYGVPEGLAHTYVKAIHQDRKGYIWFGTADGLSRYDGYHFTSYGKADGLGDASVNEIAEDPSDRLWVATNGGLSRLVDSGPPSARFVKYLIGGAPKSNSVNNLLFDQQDRLWCVSDDGLYRTTLDKAGEPGAFELVVKGSEPYWNCPAFSDSKGRLWFGLANQLIEVAGDQVIKYSAADSIGAEQIQTVLEDGRGAIVAASLRGIFEFVENTDNSARGHWKQLPLSLIRTQAIHSVVAGDSSGLWLGTSYGLANYRDGRQTLYNIDNGLSDHHILSLARDREGNLWIGTVNGGVCRLAGQMITSFDNSCGLDDLHIYRLLESRDGTVYVASDGSPVEIDLARGRARVLLFGRHNEYWARVLEDVGWRPGAGFSGLEWTSGPKTHQENLGRSKRVGGITRGQIVSLYRDSSGRVWGGVSDDPYIYWADPGMTGRPVFNRISIAPFTRAAPIVADRSGAIWFGCRRATGGFELARLASGKLSVIAASDRPLESWIRDLFVDSRGWLWVALGAGGALVTEEPAAETPRFRAYSRTNGLASDIVSAVTEDDFGRIYFGTSRGLDQLDLATGRLRSFTSADGLAGDKINYLMKGSQGLIWIGASGGVSRLDPRAERRSTLPPPVYLSRVQIAGDSVALPETGASSMHALELPASNNSIVVEFVSPSFSSQQQPGYQYKLEGVDTDWSQPTDRRSVNYARISPGSYRFLVRALTQDGVSSLEPAVMEFRVLAPVWRRWWFLTLAALLAGFAVHLVYRYRIARLLELERIRTRIATDLHDDIGSSLSRIAILSEALIRRDPDSRRELKSLLSQIADTARGLVDDLSDVIWSIDPRLDDLGDLVLRIREFATDVFDAVGIKWSLDGPPEPERVKIAPEQRRQIYLIFKEAINNVARHAHCARVRLSIAVADSQMVGEILDDGCGFADSPGEKGHGGHGGRGLGNMETRAAQAGGICRIESAPGGGTSIQLRIPLGRHRA